MGNWFLIKTKPRKEIIAINNLKNQNYRVYCPIVSINKKNVVLFPGYLFIFLDETSDNWSRVRSTKGVLNFVKFGLNFAKISENVIEFIKTNENLTSEKINKLDKFMPGENVQVTDGAFKNCIAIFKSYKPDERVNLLIYFLGQEQTINVKKKSIIEL